MVEDDKDDEDNLDAGLTWDDFDEVNNDHTSNKRSYNQSCNQCRHKSYIIQENTQKDINKLGANQSLRLKATQHSFFLFLCLLLTAALTVETTILIYAFP